MGNTLKFATIQTSMNLRNFERKSKKRNKLNTLLNDVSIKLSKYIRINQYKKDRMITKLKILNLHITPEKHLADIYIKTLIPIAISIPISLIFPIFFPVSFVIAIRIYFTEKNVLDKNIQIKRDKIEKELPRFTREVAENLKSTRDVLWILERYKETAGEDFKKELEITLIDMKTGNYEQALTRFDVRIQSSMLSSVIRGLQTVLRGDKSREVFERLANDFKMLELEMLKREAVKRPSKIKKYSVLMLGTMLFMYTTIIIMAIMQGMGDLF